MTNGNDAETTNNTDTPQAGSRRGAPPTFGILGAVLVAIAVYEVFAGGWLEAAMAFCLGIALLTARFPVFGRGRWQAITGYTLAAVAVVLFGVVITRDLAG